MRLLLAFLVFAGLLSPSPGGAAGVPVGGTGRIRPPVHVDGASPALRLAMRKGPARADASQSGFPTFQWPLGRVIGDGVVIVNQTDLDPTTARRDYMGGTWNYDGHTGTDFGLHDFRAMDRGVPVLAAASGTVAYVGGPSPYDRHCTFDWPDDGNWIWIDAGGGVYHEYLHLRAGSRTVQVGESVSAGQVLGLVGSSGYSTLPHLHFETGDYSGPGATYQFRDPFSGPANPLPGLWASQPAYPGTQPLRGFDLGVFPESLVGGSVFNTSFCDVVEQIPQPAVFGRSEERLAMWFQFQAHAGDSATIVVRKPDGGVYGEFVYDVLDDQSFGWFWAWFYFQPYTTPADDGTWRLQLWHDGQLAIERPFVVGATTAWGPRFAPPAGRSFTIDGSAQRDTLRRLPTSPPVTYALLGAPPFVSLVQDSIVQVAGTSTQGTRSAWFQAVMTDAQARRDTAWFHVVDFSKPLEPVTATEPATPGPCTMQAFPNPFREATRIAWTAPSAGRASLEVFDVSGRRVRTLQRGAVSAGPHAREWDGRDDAGASVSPGLYFARLATAGAITDTRLVRIR